MNKNVKAVQCHVINSILIIATSNHHEYSRWPLNNSRSFYKDTFPIPSISSSLLKLVTAMWKLIIKTLKLSNDSHKNNIYIHNSLLQHL